MLQWPCLKETALVAVVVVLSQKNPRLLLAWMLYAVWKNRQEFFE